MKLNPVQQQMLDQEKGKVGLDLHQLHNLVDGVTDNRLAGMLRKHASSLMEYSLLYSMIHELELSGFGLVEWSTHLKTALRVWQGTDGDLGHRMYENAAREAQKKLLDIVERLVEKQ